MSPEYQEAFRLLMLVPFGLVVGAIVMFAISLARWVRDARFRNQLAQFDIPMPVLPGAKVRQFLFERPTTWLAIKGTDPRKLQTALGLHDAMFCSWEEGLIEAREHKLFISPSVAGWILVVGSDLPEPDEDVDKCFHFLTDLSRKVGHLQYFCGNRALNHHAWAIVDRGQVFRAYAWAGQTVWNQGPITAAERELGVACFPYLYRLDFTHREAVAANTEKVNALAGRWSLDPNAVVENAWTSEQGIVGSFSLPNFH
jgi:hypothetical protein